MSTNSAPSTPPVAPPAGTVFRCRTRSGVLRPFDAMRLSPVPKNDKRQRTSLLLLPPLGKPVELELDPETACWIGFGPSPEPDFEYRYQLYNPLEDIWLLALLLVEKDSGEIAEAPAEMAGTWGSENGGGPAEEEPGTGGSDDD
jgi:hypothetical protein